MEGGGCTILLTCLDNSGVPPGLIPFAIEVPGLPSWAKLDHPFGIGSTPSREITYLREW